MKISTSPRFVIYTDYSDCTIKQALLHALQNAENNLLTLPEIGNIRVNGNRLLGSYGDAIRDFRKQGYQIDTQYSNSKNGVICTAHKLKNPTHSPDDSEQFNNI